ncbi:hypothetical protein JL722_2870 [Aureococcus anophagefferens]|nr:hypothetical protein JL722_2870 [Aureococcus anophagefferens]
MGPKKEKKKKKSKAELEQERIDRERQEEIDAKERARKLEEQREREREAEQRLKEAQKQARVEELELLNVEAREEAGVMERRRARIDEERAADEEARAWENYRACDPLPAGESDRELNTYISQLYDDMTETRIQADLGGDFTLDEALERVARTERISQSLEDLRADAVARGDAAAALRCGRFLHRLRDGVVAQLDRATAHVLQHADDTSAKSEDAKKEIFVVGSDVAAEAAALKREEAKAAAGLPGHAAGKDEEPKAGAGSPTKAPAALGFQDVDLHVDLPKTLGTQRLGARVFLLPYEHVSAAYRGDRFAEDEIVASVRGSQAVPEGGAPGALLPGDEMHPLGGSIQLEVVELPPPPKEIKPKWTMQQLTGLATSVKVAHFPPGAEVDTPFVYTGSGVPAPNQYLRARVVVPESIIVPAAPDDASDSPLRVAWWDTSRKSWIDGTTSGVEYNEAKREVGFNLARSGVLALVQPRTLDLPYEAWSLSPALPVAAPYDSEVEEACCRLSLATPRFEVVIEVRGDGSCTLLEPSRVPELAGLLGRDGRAAPAMKPGRLLAALSKAGIHLRPDDADAAACTRKRASFALKHGDVERKLCEEVAALARLRLRRVPAGKDLGRDRCGLRARETSTYVGGGANALDFMTVLVERDAASKSAREAPGVGELPGAAVKCTLVMGDENYDEVPPGGVDPETAPPAVFDESPLGAATSHIFLHRCLRATVELLHLTRPFSFF